MVKLGVIGLGIGLFHIRKIVESKEGVLAAICDIDENKLKTVGEQYGVPENRRFTNYKDLIACEDVEAVEVCTPNYLHTKMAVDVIKANKPVQVEKPMDVDYASAQEMLQALKENPVVNMAVFSYRFYPATRYAKYILDKKMIGDIVSVRIEYLKDSAFWKGRRLDWRFVKKYAGAGVIADLGAHLIDMAEFLVGKVEKVFGTVSTVVKERQVLNGEEYAMVETDDCAQGMMKFDCGATATFNISRCAHGHQNHIVFDVYGTEGVISFDLNNPEVLNVCVGELDLNSGKPHQISVPASYRLTQEQAFIRAVQGKPTPYHPTIEDGMRCQKIIDAVLKSDEEGKWISVQ